METTYRLITIPVSHYCEKARWALDRVDAAYREEPHPPIFHYRRSRGAGGERTVPVLVTEFGVFPDSTDILQFLDSRYGNGWRPYPEDAALREEVEELEEFFDTKLGPHTRRAAYFYLLPEKKLFLETALRGAGAWERSLFPIVRPTVCWLMRRGMNITAESAERSLGKVREVFATVSDSLADGRPFLVGETFSAADLTFAALAAPVILPRGYGGSLPALSDLPRAFLTLVEEFRTTPAGAFAQRMYRDHR
jgi:glutathione S-transferase